MPTYVALYVMLILFWTIPAVFGAIWLAVQRIRRRPWTLFGVITAVNIGIFTFGATEFVWVFAKFVPRNSAPLSAIGWSLFVLLVIGYGAFYAWYAHLQLDSYRQLPPMSHTHTPRQRRITSARRRLRASRLQRAGKRLDTMEGEGG